MKNSKGGTSSRGVVVCGSLQQHASPKQGRAGCSWSCRQQLAAAALACSSCTLDFCISFLIWPDVPLGRPSRQDGEKKDRTRGRGGGAQTVSPPKRWVTRCLMSDLPIPCLAPSYSPLLLYNLVKPLAWHVWSAAASGALQRSTSLIDSV